MPPPLYRLQQLPLPRQKPFVRKLPLVRINFSKTVGVELSYEAGEIVVLEVARQDGGRELVRVPNDETVAGSAPRNDVVGGWVFHNVEGFGEKRRGTHLVQPFHGLRGEV